MSHIADISHRDQYGFLKSSQWISEDAFNGFENYYAPIMKRRSLKWRQLLAENDDQWPARSSKSKCHYDCPSTVYSYS